MKKLILVICFIVLIYTLLGNISTSFIPKDSLRIRIIANSNTEYDQKIKNLLKKQIQYKLYNLLKNTKGIKEARKIVNNNLKQIDKDVQDILLNNSYDLNYDINFGLNYFPAKEYKGITYDEGYYESLVITLGEGKGDNWWCVLFPPLCLIEAEENDGVEYTTLVKEMMNKYRK